LSSVDLLKGNRTAIAVGINTYKEPGIPQLTGAENDAQELFKLLASQKAGFENNPKNLILGEEATQRNISERISEIFRNDKKYEIALFYFSGHGFLDKKEELYLATYDIDEKDPYIGGIRIDDLRRQIYTSDKKQNAILVLDCCFSGTATKDTNAKGNEIPDPRLYLETNIGYNTEQEQYGEGEGKFTITSTAANKASYEVKDCIHQENNQPHVHGALTYYLLQGLEGAAANPNSGIITLGSLQQYIDTKMYEDKKQKSYTHGSQVTNINNILIALSITKYKDNLENLVTEINQYLDIPDSSFPIIKYVIAGAKKLKELKSINPTNQSITTINERITSQLELYKKNVINWCIALPDDIVFKIENNTTRGFIDDFRRQVGALQCNTLSDIDEKWKRFLNSIGNEVRNNINYTDKNDPNLDPLLANLSANYKLFREHSK
jgi:uncharacterized caspase-like protein